jgi:hypothetical protein
MYILHSRRGWNGLAFRFLWSPDSPGRQTFFPGHWWDLVGPAIIVPGIFPLKAGSNALTKWTLDSLPPAQAQNNSYLTSTGKSGKIPLSQGDLTSSSGSVASDKPWCHLERFYCQNSICSSDLVPNITKYYHSHHLSHALSRLCWPELQIISNYCINAYIGPQKESNRSIWTCLQMGHTVPPNGRFNQKNHGKSSLSTKFRLSYVF